MITFTRYLEESLSSSYHTNVVVWDADGMIVSFTDDAGKRFQVTIEPVVNDHELPTIHVSFVQIIGTRPTMNLTRDITNPIKVYATIGGIIKQYVQRYPVSGIEFAAVTDRVVPLYAKLARKMATELNGEIVPTRFPSHFKIALKA